VTSIKQLDYFGTARNASIRIAKYSAPANGNFFLSSLKNYASLLQVREFHRLQSCVSSSCKQPVRKQVIKNTYADAGRRRSDGHSSGSGIGFYLCLIPKRAHVVGSVA